MKDFGFIDSLKIDSMIILIKESYRGFADLELDNFFSTDERVLEYRLGVVSDLIAQSSEFQTLNTELSKMETTFGYLKSVTLGINLDGNLCPLDAGIVSVNTNMFIFLCWTIFAFWLPVENPFLPIRSAWRRLYSS